MLVDHRAAMYVGIFAKTFARPSLEATLDAVLSLGVSCVQFNMSCAGLPSLPEQIPAALAEQIRGAFAARKINAAAVSGTFNMSHPDQEHRRDGLRRLAVLIAACPAMGIPVVTLCTGTRDRDDMWRKHPDSQLPDAYRDCLETTRRAVEIAERHGVTLAFEPEVSSVIDTPQKARQLLDDVGSPRLKVVMDGANVFHAGTLSRMRQVLDEAFEYLGNDIAIAHAKDLAKDGEAGDLAAGTGLLDYDHYLDCLDRVHYAGPLILHGLSESQAPASVAFLKEKLTRQMARRPH